MHLTFEPGTSVTLVGLHAMKTILKFCRVKIMKETIREASGSCEIA